MDTYWFYQADASSGSRCGPISETRLRELAKSGSIKPSDQVWTPGMQSWTYAGTVKGLFVPSEEATAGKSGRRRRQRKRDKPVHPQANEAMIGSLKSPNFSISAIRVHRDRAASGLTGFLARVAKRLPFGWHKLGMFAFVILGLMALYCVAVALG
ncbi:MAG: DUF4339 domain-containing protein [Planctomycetes bacterium]|nr:DUF4339 domain-containing protein [Planctomycetota bacterium]